MNKRRVENSLTTYNKNIFEKIRMFFKNLVEHNKQSQNTIQMRKRTSASETQDFIENIKIPESRVNAEVQKMKNDFENGLIIEEDLCEAELKQLRELYIKQIEEKKQSIENYKNRIMKVKAQLPK